MHQLIVCNEVDLTCVLAGFLSDQPQSCSAVDGTGKGKACVFPFKWVNVTYDKCNYYNGKVTCATEVDDNGTTIEHGSCNPHHPQCPIIDG